MTSEAQASRSLIRTWLITILLAVGFGALYVAFTPHTADLAAQTARSELFRRSGFVPFWASWYAGMPTASYSLITPPLLGWLGPVWLGALAVVGTAAVVVPLLRDAARPRAGAVAFVVLASFDVVSGRTTFAIGAVAALAALLAVERGRPMVAIGVAAVATAASPVAGFLLLVVAAALVLADAGRRRIAGAAGAAVAVTLVALAALSHGDGGGYQPFTKTSMLMAVGTALVVVLAPVSRRIRVSAAVTVVMLLVLYFVHSPIGANGTRLAVLASAPTIVAAGSRSHRLMTAFAVVVASLLPLSQLHNDLSASRHHDASRAFVAPLRAALAADPSTRDHRVELVDSATHWPSAYLPPTVTLARGWERQTDEALNPMFYGRAPLTPASYRSFLDRFGVSVVAVAQGVPLDWGTKAEGALIATGLPYLHQIWSSEHWRLYAVSAPTALITAPGRVVSLQDTGLSVEVPAAGSYDVKLRWSPYLVVSGGRVMRTANGDLRLELATAGPHRLHAVWRFP